MAGQNVFRMVIELIAKDKNASVTMEKFGKSTAKAGKKAQVAAGSLKQLAGAFTSLVVASKVSNAIQSIVDPARKMEIAMMRLSFLTGETSAKLGAMRKVAEDVAKVTTFGPQEAADALSQLVRATGSADVAMKSLATTTGLAMASFGKLTLEGSTRMVSDMAKSFSMSADEIAAAGDKIMAVSKSAGVGVEEMKQVMGYLGTGAIRGEQSFDEMMSSFMMVRRILPSSRRAATQLMRVMGEFTKKKAVEAMDSIGVATTDATGHIRAFSDIMLDLAKASEMDSIRVRDALNAGFGESSMKPIMAMLAQLKNGMVTSSGAVLTGSQIFEHFNGVLNNSKGAVQAASDAYMETASSGLTRLGEAFDMLKTQLGEQILPSLGVVAKALADATVAIIEFGKAIPGPIKWLLAMSFKSGLLIASVMALRMAWVGAKMIFKGALEYMQKNSAAAKVASTSMDQYATSTKRATMAMREMKSLAPAGFIGPMEKGQKRLPTGTGMPMGRPIFNRAVASLTKAEGSLARIKTAMGGVKSAAVAVGGFLKTNWLGLLLVFSDIAVKLFKMMDNWFDKMEKREFAEAMGLRVEKVMGKSKRELRALGVWRESLLGERVSVKKALSIKDYKEAVKQFKATNVKLTTPLIETIKWQKRIDPKVLAEEQFKRQWEQHQKMLKDKEAQDLKATQRWNSTFKAGSRALRLGSEPLTKAITRWEALINWKPKVLDIDKANKIDRLMHNVVKRGEGGTFKGKTLTKGDLAAMQAAQAGYGMWRRVQVKAMEGRATVAEVNAANEAMAKTKLILNKVLPPSMGEHLTKLFDATLGATVQSVSAKNFEASTAYLRGTKGASIFPSGAGIGPGELATRQAADIQKKGGTSLLDNLRRFLSSDKLEEKTVIGGSGYSNTMKQRLDYQKRINAPSIIPEEADVMSKENREAAQKREQRDAIAEKDRKRIAVGIQELVGFVKDLRYRFMNPMSPDPGQLTTGGVGTNSLQKVPGDA